MTPDEYQKQADEKLLAAGAVPQQLMPAKALGLGINTSQKEALPFLKPDGTMDVQAYIQDALKRADEKELAGAEILAKQNKGQPLSTIEALGMIAATVLPVIAGAAFYGKKGAFAGLKAAGEGGVAGMKVREEAAGVADAANTLLAKREMSEAEKLRNQVNKLQTLPIEQQIKGEAEIKKKEELLRKGLLNTGTTVNVNPFQGNIPGAAKVKLAESESVVNEGFALAQEIRDWYEKNKEKKLEAPKQNLPENIDEPGIWDRVEFQFDKNFTATDAGKLMQKVQLFIRRQMVATEGGRPSDFDTRSYIQLLGGDLTASPLDVAELLEYNTSRVAKQAAGMTRSLAQDLVDVPSALSFADRMEQKATTYGSGYTPKFGTSAAPKKPGSTIKLGNYTVGGS